MADYDLLWASLAVGDHLHIELVELCQSTHSSQADKEQMWKLPLFIKFLMAQSTYQGNKQPVEIRPK